MTLIKIQTGGCSVNTYGDEVEAGFGGGGNGFGIKVQNGKKEQWFCYRGAGGGYTGLLIIKF